MLAALALTLAFAASPVPAPGTAPPPWATGESKPEDIAIDLALFGPGHEVTGWFGHTALVVRDRRLGKSRLYNYGEFSFDELMLARYAMGHLEFWVGERPVEHTFGLYRKEGRSITSLHLRLTPEERAEVARFLADNALPENKHYTYDHYSDNCATKPRDVIDRAVRGRLRAAATPARFTLREHSLRHTAAFLPLGWLIDFMLNARVDQPITTWEESFLPGELAKNLRALDLIGGETVHAKSEIVARDAPPVMWPALVVVGVVLGAATLALRRRARALAWWSAVVGGLASMPGIALFTLWAFTDHFITYKNENILLSSPVTFAAAALSFVAATRFGRPLGERAARGARALWTALAAAALVAVVIKALPWFGQQNLPHLVLFVPLVVSLAVSWRLRPSALESVAPSPSALESVAPSPSALESVAPSPSALESVAPSPSALESVAPSPSALESVAPSPSAPGMDESGRSASGVDESGRSARGVDDAAPSPDAPEASSTRAPVSS